MDKHPQDEFGPLVLINGNYSLILQTLLYLVEGLYLLTLSWGPTLQLDPTYWRGCAYE